MAVQISRREFLKIGLSGLASALVLPPGSPFGANPPGDDPFPMRSPAYEMGRAALSGFFYKEASFDSQKLKGYNTNTIFKIYAQKVGEPYLFYKPLWYETDSGWINAAYIQSVRQSLNEPLTEIPNGGLLGEITVPFTWVWEEKKGALKRKYPYYYEMTCWFDFVSTDKTGQTWYRIYDDLNETYYWMPAEHVRPVTAEEIAPLSPEVADKRVEVLLNDQVLVAYENGQAVFSTPISTGAQEGDTKPGEYVIERKRPTRHMAPMEGNGYDLPGVPWVGYISWTGVSIHGTYWHNNFGHPMSHGCINLPSQAAKWVYRWSLPVVPLDVQNVKTDGTVVKVIV